MRTVVLNDELYEVTERTYRKLVPALGKKIKVLGEDGRRREHERRCAVVRGEGRKVSDRVDLILRDD